ncbi:MAG: oligosaccharide flippase family protein [Candidatus Buchananbacteria bacterium]|nr:oligosaccharide flippase family protein [Candidatus Buchananbacteria bacterium]
MRSLFKSAPLKIHQLLRWSERYTKTDMVYLFKGGSWLLSGNALLIIIAFALSVAYANWLSPETYGTYRYILSVASLLALTSLPGMKSAVSRAIALEQVSTLRQGFKARVRWSLLGTAMGLAIAGYYAYQDNFVLSIGIALVSLLFPLAEALDLYQSFFLGKKLFHRQAIANATTAIFQAVVICAILLIQPNNVWYLLIGFFGSEIIIHGFWWWRIKALTASNASNAETIAYGKHLTVITTLNSALLYIDRLLVFQFIGAAQLASFVVATAPTEQLRGLVRNIQTMAMPKFTQQTAIDRQSLWYKILLFGLAIAGGTAIYILLAPMLFTFLFPQYLSGIGYSRLFALSLPAISVSGFVASILEARAHRRALYHYNVISNVISIILLIPGLFFFGIFGLIGSRVIARYFSLAYACILCDRSLKHHEPELVS